MRVVIIADRLFASRERSMLARLQVGLADEGIRVVQALPQGVEPASGGMLSETVHFEEAGLPLSLGWRAAATAQILIESASASDGETPQIVHAFGGTVWDFGLALAERLDAAFILETWRAGLSRAVQRVLAKSRGRTELIALCPDRGLVKRVQAEASGVAVRYSPWGVYADEPTGIALEPDRAWSIMVAGAGFDRQAFSAAFEAIADVVRARPDVLVFVDALAARRTDLWCLAAKLGVRDRLSLVDEMDTNRDLVLRGDVLILPEARGEQRTLVLEAMGRRMPIVAAADPMNSTLIDGRSALLVPPGDRARWTQQLESLLSTRDLVESITASAREYVAEEHRPSRQVNCVIDAYEAVVGKKSIPFPG
jgi:glycosyltransferase involved in cell wall biosynthesis